MCVVVLALSHLTPHFHKYTDSERLKIPKTEYLLTDLEDEESVSIDFQVCRSQKYRVPYHLMKIPDVTFFESTNPVLPQNKHDTTYHILEDH